MRAAIASACRTSCLSSDCLSNLLYFHVIRYCEIGGSLGLPRSISVTPSQGPFCCRCWATRSPKVNRIKTLEDASLKQKIIATVLHSYTHTRQCIHTIKVDPFQKISCYSELRVKVNFKVIARSYCTAFPRKRATYSLNTSTLMPLLYSTSYS